MLKMTAIVSLVICGNILSASSLSCDSCGSECSSACGTRYFRSCCFNYLRKKRGPDTTKLYAFSQDMKESQPRAKFPMIVAENIPMPEQWLTNMQSIEKKSIFSGDLA